MVASRSTESPGGRPACSIIIPTYNRPRELASCLESLTRLESPAGGFEVIVVDDGGPEPLDAVVEPFHERLDLRLLRQANAGPGAARNAGTAAARGRFVAFTDDDCWPQPEWLCRLAARLERDPGLLVGGRTLNRLVDNAFATTSQVIIHVVYAFYNADPEDARFFASNNMAISRRLLEEVGGFDTRTFRNVSEDRELCDRWRHLGHRMAYVPEATILHAHRLALGAFCRQHFTYGRGAARYHRRRHERGSGRITEDMPMHAQLPRLLRAPLAQLPVGLRLRVVALLAVWQAANAAGFVLDPWMGGRK